MKLPPARQKKRHFYFCMTLSRPPRQMWAFFLPEICPVTMGHRRRVTSGATQGIWYKKLEQSAGIDPASSARKAEVIAIIRGS
ncbi:hypothetical protein E1670_23280 [Salmonella enterica subsp. enterica serovar Carrau]|nr:hypothetical protein [Salmonella enterica subsp. enterica serovar Carrau]